MKRVWTAVLIALGALTFACNDLGDGGGGGGGGGGVNFTRGYVWVNPGDRNVYIADQSNLDNLAALTSSGGNQEPAISPSGRQVVFVHKDANGTADLEVVSTSGGSSSVLVPAGTVSNPRQPVYTADGASIVFVYDDANGGAQLAIVRTDGSGLNTLTSGALSYAAPSANPADGMIYAAAGNATSSLTQIEKIDPVQGTEQNVTNALPSNIVTIADRLAVSPDGTRIAFEGRIDSGVTRIFELAINTPDTVTQLTDHPGDANANDSYPTWAGSSTIAFASDTGGASQVYTAASGSSGVAGTLTIPSAIMPNYGP